MHCLTNQFANVSQHFTPKSEVEIIAFLTDETNKMSKAPFRLPKDNANLSTPYAQTAVVLAQELAALRELKKRYGLEYIIRSRDGESSVKDYLVNLSRKAGISQVWYASPLVALSQCLD